MGHAGAPCLAARKAIVSESRNDADRAGDLFSADGCSAGSLCELEDQMVIGRCSLNGAGVSSISLATSTLLGASVSLRIGW